MTNKQSQQRYEIGMVGLGVMGRNLVLNIADHGFSVAGYDQDPNQVEALRKDSADRDICGTDNISDFISKLRPPRAVMMLVPAGAPVDSVIKDVLPHLDKGAWSWIGRALREDGSQRHRIRGDAIDRRDLRLDETWLGLERC